MAARRVAKSAIDWAAFAERVPAHQKDAFRTFKGRSDALISKIHRYPEGLANIDWAFYKSRIALPGLVDSFQKGYGGVTVPYPKDKDNVKATVDKQQTEATTLSKEAVARAKVQIAEIQAVLNTIDSVPQPEEMTQEMYFDYFPEQARNPWERPTYWPHTFSDQPGNNPNEIK